MKHEMIAFRPSQKCSRKLQELVDEEKNRTDVLEEAVDYYYAMRNNQLTDDPVYHLLQSVINEAMERWSGDIRNSLVSSRYDMQYVLAYLDMCLKGFGFEKDEARALQLIHEKSHFKQELDRQIAIMAEGKIRNER